MRVEFGDCVFDGETRELTRGGEQRHLSPKVFRLLEVLLEARPRVLRKAELHEKVWPGTFVSDATLASAIAEIRDAVGDRGRRKARFIRTVHGFGYGFGGEAHGDGATASAGGAEVVYRLTWNDCQVELRKGENVLGRGPGVAVWIDDASVSRRHAKIVIDGDTATLEDLRSKNGTFAEGRKILAPTALGDTAEIRVGKVDLTLRVFRALGSTVSLERLKRSARRQA